MRLLILIILISVLVQGCGQKGDLYLPENELASSISIQNQ